MLPSTYACTFSPAGQLAIYVALAVVFWLSGYITRGHCNRKTLAEAKQTGFDAGWDARGEYFVNKPYRIVAIVPDARA